MRRLGLALALLVPLASLARGQGDPERARAAKDLFFAGRYAEARGAWQELLRGSRGGEADTAAYWIARCSEKLREDERALREYGEYVARRPSDAAIVEEAKTSRVALAVRLAEAGNRAHLGVAEQSLSDSSRTVRYFAALQLGRLGPPAGLPAVPVLQSIIAEEKDRDLVSRAQLTLLKLDKSALKPAGKAAAPRRPESPGPRPAGAEARWFRLRIYEAGGKEAVVSINLPVGLAELACTSLPDDARGELKKKGYDCDGLWQKLRKLGPTQFLDIQGDDGERIQIWLE
jgi:hypothetical protein